jgi:hypothetical protein
MQGVGVSCGGITTTYSFLKIGIMDQNLKGRAHEHTALIATSELPFFLLRKEIKLRRLIGRRTQRFAPLQRRKYVKGTWC